jgi:predicted transcriptional regulator
MSNVITVRIDEEVKVMLDSFSKRSKTGKNEIINKALRHYIYLQEVKEIREELRPYAEAQGYYKEDDLFESIS